MRPGAKRRVLRWGAAGIVLLGAMLSASAESLRELIQQGNQHYAGGRYAEALKCYEQAAAGQVNPPLELLHDLAAAHFKLGQLEEARDLWVRIKEAGDADYEARTRYNLGNCDYAEALAAASQNPQQALDRLGEAADQYRTALQLNPRLTDARANLELAQRLKQQIEEQTQNQPQSQPSQKQQKGRQQPSSQPRQSQPSEQSQESEQDQSATSQPAQSQPDQQSKRQDAQQNEEEQPQDQNQPPQSEQDQQAAPETQPQSQPAQTQPAQDEQGANEAAPIHLTREQAERLLQMIRDAEKARREKLAQQRTATQKKVERDW
jgi:Ca-activated chloride channel family protein